MARFSFHGCCFALLVAASLTVLYPNRALGIHLAHRCVSIDPAPPNKLPVIMLHGITDTKETWDGIYQGIPILTGRRVCVYDARNHGDSGWNDSFNADYLAEDLGNFMKDMKIEKASLVGHSMGGITVMKFTLKNPEKVESIFVEDIAPKSVTKEVGEDLSNIFRGLLNSLSAIPAGADEETALKSVIDYITKITENPPHLGLFKISPLRFQDGKWQWKANLEVFIKSFGMEGSIVGKPLDGVFEGRAFFIYGEASPFKVNEHEEDIRKFFPNAEFFGVEGADHVVHANASVYTKKLVQFLNGKESPNSIQETL